MKSQDEIMKEFVDLVRTGSGGNLTLEEESFLRDRYYDWIVELKKNVGTTPQQVCTTPQQVWDEAAGLKMRERIQEIGKLMAERKTLKPVLGKDDCAEICRTVETSSTKPCPHCPGDPTG